MKKAQQFVNLDADEGIYFEKELEYLKAKSYDVLYPELLARRLFPVDSSADTGAATITYQTWDHVGMAKLIHQYAQDVPNIEITAKETTRKIYSEGVAFGYSMQDIRNARYAGKPLEQRKASAARRQVLQLENTLAFHGDANTDIPPFVNNPNFNQVTLGTGLVGDTWADKSADEIILDICNMVSAIRDISNGVEAPNTLLIPEAQYTQLSCTPRSTTSDTTILNFVLQSNAWISEVIPTYELKLAASGGTEDVAILYDKSPDKLTLEIPQDVEFLPPQENGFMFEILTHARTAGVIVYYPKSVAQMDGI